MSAWIREGCVYCPTCGAKPLGADGRSCGGCGLALRDDGPDIHCAVCNIAAPRRAGAGFRHHYSVMIPDASGWMRSFFPWKDPPEGARWPEEQWICPKDAAEVAKFITHRRQPMVDDFDNLPDAP
jgi:hypothetical protein